MYAFSPVTVFFLSGSEFVIVENATNKTVTVDPGEI